MHVLKSFLFLFDATFYEKNMQRHPRYRTPAFLPPLSFFALCFYRILYHLLLIQPILSLMICIQLLFHLLATTIFIYPYPPSSIVIHPHSV